VKRKVSQEKIKRTFLKKKEPKKVWREFVKIEGKIIFMEVQDFGQQTTTRKRRKNSEQKKPRRSRITEISPTPPQTIPKKILPAENIYLPRNLYPPQSALCPHSALTCVLHFDRTN
jgi:hypothetical protein